MIPFLRSLRAQSIAQFVLILLLILAGNISCSAGNSGSIHLVVGGKLDIEAQLLTKMYVLLLRHAGFDVEEMSALGGNDTVFRAITGGQIDLYPEFTATGLARMNLTTTHDPQRDYQNVKNGYETRYHITWLNVAPLDDTYGICTSKAMADQLHLEKISQLAPLTSRMTIATPADGQFDPNVLPGLKPTYGITFDKVIRLDEASTFQAVIQGQAQVNICYTTVPLIAQNNFVLLQDDKNSFPIYNPAPIVRDDTLQKAPQIATILNQLAPRLTTDVSIILQRQVNSGFSITEVATTWLESQGLL